MLQVFAHPDLPHQFVFVSVHTGQLAYMSEHVLQPVGQLEGVDVVEAVLNVGIDYEFSQPKNFTTKMERCEQTNKKLSPKTKFRTSDLS